MKRIVQTLVAAAIVFLLVQASWYSYLFKGVYATYLQGHVTSNIFDGESFEQGAVSAPNPQPWPVQLDMAYAPSDALQSLLSDIETGAFLVFVNDTLRYEDYDNKVRPDSKTNSFSMAKSIVTMLVQIAIQEGQLSGWDAKAADFLPELHGPGAAQLTLGHLSSMTADLDWDEDYYNPFGVTAKAYYGKDLRATVTACEVGEQVGQRYEYQSGATALLGFCLEAATGMKVHEYASAKLWGPMGATSDAFWHLDDSGNALTYCCFNATARDYGRLGKLLLQHGRWNGEVLVDSTFLYTASTPGLEAFYGYSFWLGSVDAPEGEMWEAPVPYVAYRGHLGQWIVAIPHRNMILVRTGHQEGSGDRENGLPSSFVQTVTEYVQRDFTARLSAAGEELESDFSDAPAEPLTTGESDALPVDSGR
ncbi:MAG: serine hydrolase domain-containing protein [Schleiferiaceae bacterium]